MKIQSTKDYSIFKKQTGNRGIIPYHVNEILKELQRKNLNEYSPLWVNERMEIIDGQHRLEALRKMGACVHYVIIPGLGLGDTQKSNAIPRRWSLQNYIDTEIKKGNDNYIKLYEFMRNFKLPAGTSAAILSGFPTDVKGGKITNAIRYGYFRIANYDKALKIGDFIAKCRKFVPRNVQDDREFWTALVFVYKNPDSDKNKFIHKMSIQGQSLQRMATKKDYLREFERIYTFMMSEEKKREIRFF